MNRALQAKAARAATQSVSYAQSVDTYHYDTRPKHDRAYYRAICERLARKVANAGEFVPKSLRDAYIAAYYAMQQAPETVAPAQVVNFDGATVTRVKAGAYRGQSKRGGVCPRGLYSAKGWC
tara:strand:- start:188 stop:553 length:366 start_codon:yes stop_codon:yes gene_type:complete